MTLSDEELEAICLRAKRKPTIGNVSTLMNAEAMLTAAGYAIIPPSAIDSIISYLDEFDEPEAQQLRAMLAANGKENGK